MAAMTEWERIKREQGRAAAAVTTRLTSRTTGLGTDLP